MYLLGSRPHPKLCWPYEDYEALLGWGRERGLGVLVPFDPRKVASSAPHGLGLRCMSAFTLTLTSAEARANKSLRSSSRSPCRNSVTSKTI